MDFAKVTFYSALLGTFLVLSACASEGRFERTGQEIDEVVDEVEDALE